jgi:hypothetical protein
MQGVRGARSDVVKSELIPLNGDPPIPITRDVTLVGRREFCDVTIPHPSLSKRHCILVRTDGLLIIRDLISTNGTKVNGQRVMWAALLPNDRLSLGRMKFKVYLGPDDVLSPSELGQRRPAAEVAEAGVEASPAPVLNPALASINAHGFSEPSPPFFPVLSPGCAQPEPAVVFGEGAPPLPRTSEPIPLSLDDDDDDEGLEIYDDPHSEPFFIELDD